MGRSSSDDKTKKYKIKTAKVSDKKVNKKKESKKDKTGKKKHPKLKKFIIICLIIFVLLILIGIGVFAGIFFSDKWKVNREDLEISLHNTTVYDKDGKQIAELTGDENRKIITLSEMGDYIPNAFVAIEDERFYSHYGIDIKRTAGAIVTYITHGGKSSFGGSTITQQLVKNMMNDSADSGFAGIERKIREWSRAYQIEKMFSKSQILELYLNEIFMGSTVYGVESASQYYFSKSAKDLSLAESAFIAGINNAPNSYNPFGETDNSEKIKTRTKTVLNQMKKLRDTDVKELEGLTKITDEDYEKAFAEVDKGLKFKKGSTASTSNISYHTAAAVDQVARELAEEKDVNYDTARSMVFNGGYKLYTTQDSDIQDIMEEEYLKSEHIRSSKKTKGSHAQSGMVIIDHKTGQVVGCVGGLGSDSSTIGLNRATQINRQPGSSIKPLVAVGPALEEKVITAATIYNDVKTDFGNGYIRNAGSYRGNISVRQGIECSSNIVNMKILSNLGVDKGIKYANEFGLSYYNKEQDSSLGLAIGGTTNGTNPLQMAAAYATIARGGEYIEPTFYTKLESGTGKVVLEPKQETRRVLSEQTAYVLTDILKSPVNGFKGGATARVCKISGMDTAAKTGTTSYYKDKWLCGFTPYYAAATWYGFDDGELMQNFYNADSYAKNIWASVMKKVHKNLKSAKFEKPSGVVSAKICAVTGKVATSKCSDTYTEVFVSGTVPSECDGHDGITICKESGKLATEYCPETETKYNYVPEKERNANWKPNSSSKYSDITETCTLHTEETMNSVVPSVIGMSQSEAKNELSDFNVKTTFSEDTSKADGVVLKQSLAAGTSVSKGSTITLTINKITTSGGGNEPEPEPSEPKNNTVEEPTPEENQNETTEND